MWYYTRWFMFYFVLQYLHPWFNLIVKIKCFWLLFWILNLLVVFCLLMAFYYLLHHVFHLQDMLDVCIKVGFKYDFKLYAIKSLLSPIGSPIGLNVAVCLLNPCIRKAVASWANQVNLFGICTNARKRFSI